MSLTWIEVADTAVKIGLGAAVTALGSYFLAAGSHRQTLSREITTRKVRILEDACDDAEAYFSYCTHLYNTVGALAKRNEIDGRAQTEQEISLISHVHKDIPDALEARNKARAKLSLLGATEALSHLTSFNATLGKYREVIAFDAQMFTWEQHKLLTEEFKQQKSAFYIAARNFLDKIGNGA